MSEVKNHTIELFTDGACRGNPGPGGWGVLLRYKEQEKYLYGGEWYTTNNRMELMAAIQGLSALKRKCVVVVTTDSDYLRRGITEWMKNWKKNHWRTSNKKPVKNADLWQQLDVLASQFDVRWQWVRGHSGHRENEIADQLANRGIDELKK
ncbi:MAG: ribonuclease HI [Coxiella sp. RIFCSPHIGHO2_12_FULL_42_15]|nr:MAG: ribonuclease HI [Coxiella sp. RIFCSPHIGHO2_12_FULL_42_15]